MAVGALVAIAVLLSRVGDPVEFWDSIRDANWAYVALALGLGILTDVAYAIAFLGTVPVRIPLWPSIELQSSMSFSNLAVPGRRRYRDPDPVPPEVRARPALRGRDRWHLQHALRADHPGGAVRHRALALARLDQLRPDRHQPDRGRGVDRDPPDRHRRGGDVQHPPDPARGGPADRPRRVDGVGRDEEPDARRAPRLRQHRRQLPLRGVAPRVPARVRELGRLLDAARGEHRHHPDRVAGPVPGWRHRRLRRRHLRDCWLPSAFPPRPRPRR